MTEKKRFEKAMSQLDSAFQKAKDFFRSYVKAIPHWKLKLFVV